VIAFFGIRGLGSFYYVAYALGQTVFEQPQILWVTVCFVVLSSIVMHGVLVTPIMRQLDRRLSALGPQQVITGATSSADAVNQ
jgi:NhaP-type Na+/H+ or K+/H+ antiporter